MKKQWIKRIGLGLLLVILLLVAGFLVMEVLGRNSMKGKTDESVEVTVPENVDAEVEDDGDYITYRGERYRFNENVTSILCMGVDKDDISEETEVIGTSGQADMLMLVILNTETGDVKLWNISRDSMTDVDIYNVDGEYVRTESLQACLAFAYGDGSHGSCENVVRSVSRLLYGMPIQGYAAIDMDAIQPLNDAVGGVEVTIHEGDILPAKFKPGTKVLLKGKDVESYVRSRTTELPGEPIDTNNNRMARQKQYMTNFLYKVLQQTKEDITTPMKLFNIARQGEHIVTNINAAAVAYLSKSFPKISFSEGNFLTIPGEVKAGEKHAEFYVDDEVLYEMIVEAFYTKE